MTTRRAFTQREGPYEHRCIRETPSLFFFFFRNVCSQEWVEHGAGTRQMLEIGIEGKANLCLVVLFVFYCGCLFSKNNRIDKQGPCCFATQSKNDIASLIILSCYSMPVQRILESSKRINLFIATFWCISMFLSIFENWSSMQHLQRLFSSHLPEQTIVLL